MWSGVSGAVWGGVTWFFQNFLILLAAIGAASVLVRTFDAIVEKQILKHPCSRFWVYLDHALDRSDSVLGWIIDILHKIALRRSQDSQ